MFHITKQGIALSFYIFFSLAAVARAFDRYNNILDYAQLKSWIDSGQKFLLVDSLSLIEYEAGSIPGAVNIPMEDIQGSTLLPADRNERLVFFCKGAKCHKSHVSAMAAEKKGYKNVWVFDGGTPEWAMQGNPLQTKVSYKDVKVADISVADLKGKLDSHQDVILLDVQDESSFKSHSIAGAVNIPLFRLHADYAKIPLAKNVVVLDKSGKQNLIAAQFLMKKGYSKVVRLDGGVEAWLRAGHPVVSHK